MEPEALQVFVDNYSEMRLITEIANCTQSCTDTDVRCCTNKSFIDFEF